MIEASTTESRIRYHLDAEKEKFSSAKKGAIVAASTVAATMVFWTSFFSTDLADSLEKESLIALIIISTSLYQIIFIAMVEYKKISGGYTRAVGTIAVVSPLLYTDILRIATNMLTLYVLRESQILILIMILFLVSNIVNAGISLAYEISIELSKNGEPYFGDGKMEEVLAYIDRLTPFVSFIAVIVYKYNTVLIIIDEYLAVEAAILILSIIAWLTLIQYFFREISALNKTMIYLLEALLLLSYKDTRCEFLLDKICSSSKIEYEFRNFVRKSNREKFNRLSSEDAYQFVLFKLRERYPPIP